MSRTSYLIAYRLSALLINEKGVRYYDEQVPSTIDTKYLAQTLLKFDCDAETAVGRAQEILETDMDLNDRIFELFEQGVNTLSIQSDDLTLHKVIVLQAVDLV